MKGIILAGGIGSRLYPSTLIVSKQLLPIYDKPMVYYSLSVLMLAEIRDIMIVSTPQSIAQYEELLKDGSHLGLKISYAVQDAPRGLAHAFHVAEEFVGNSSVCLILGDNIFYGGGFVRQIRHAAHNNIGATVFGYYVKDPQRYGIIELSQNNTICSIEEKPEKPKSNYAVTGLYFYDNSVIAKSKKIKPSERGELEITSINKLYLEEGSLKAELLGRGVAWLDTGTHTSLLEASNFVATLEHRQGLKIACIEEISYRLGYINKTQLIELAKKYKNSEYGQYLHTISEANTNPAKEVVWLRNNLTRQSVNINKRKVI